MLQQTQVDRVVPALRALPRRLPDAGRLRGGADRRPWSGCGRGSATTAGRSTCTGRPRPWWPTTAARCPHEDAALRALPGVGPYTARAVRVVRLRGRRGRGRHQRRAGAGPRRGGHAADAARRRRRWATGSCPPASRGSSTRRCSTSGATVCTAARPDCARCPLRRQCAWRRQGVTRTAPTRGGSARRRGRRAPSPGRTARGGAACSRRCATAACGGAASPAPAAGPTTRRGPSGWRPPLVAEGFAALVRREGSRPPAARAAGRRGGSRTRSGSR